MGPKLYNRQRCSHIALACALLAACSRATDSGASADPSDGSSRSPADAGDGKVTAVTLSLENDELEPGQSTEVTVRVEPAAVHLVQLAIIAGGDDAYLDAPQLSTNVNGIGKTRLTVVAHSGEELRLQATADDERATVSVKLNERSAAELVIAPVYAGNRTFDQWQMLWGPNLSCELGYNDPAWSSAQTVVRSLAPEGSIPEYGFADVPSREPLTILVKAERFAMGCVGGAKLTPRAVNRVEIPINQRFADVSQLTFPIELNVAPESEFWSTLLTTKDTVSYLSQLTAKFRGESASDVDALLDEMGEESTDPALFRQSRESAGWDALLTTNLSPEGAQNGLSSRVQRWLQDGAKLLQSPRAFVGTLAYDDDNRGSFELVSVAGKPPDVCLLPPNHLASITVDAQDVLRVGFDLRLAPSSLFACLADSAVTGGADAGVTDVLSALAADFDCGLVAQWMTAPSGTLFDGCDTTCGAELCDAALARLWERVVFGDLTLSSLDVNAAGKASLTEDALVVGVDAIWVGTTLLAGVETSVGGALRSCSLDPDCQSMLPF